MLMVPAYSFFAGVECTERQALIAMGEVLFLVLWPCPHCEPADHTEQLTFNSFFAYLDDGGIDQIFQLLLGLISYHQTLATRIGGHAGVAELDGFRFAGFPVLSS